MGLKNKLKSIRCLYFWGRVLQNCGDAEFQESVIDVTDHPAMVKIEQLGEKNPDRLFYLIELDDAGNHSGFFALLNNTLNRLELARRLGAEPYVAWRNTAYSSGKEENTFERYFRQTCNATYAEILQSKNVVRSRSADGFLRDEGQVYQEREGYSEEIAELYRRHIHILPELEKQIKQDINDRVASGLHDVCRIGVHVRGADYRVNLKGHPSSISFKEYADAVDLCFNDYPDGRIFLATDDQRALEYFNNRYPGKICCYPNVFRSEEDLGVHYAKSDRPDHAWRLGYEVLRDVKTLAECDILIAGVSYVSFTARVMRIALGIKYTKMQIINHGINRRGETSTQFNRKYEGIKSKSRRVIQ